MSAEAVGYVYRHSPYSGATFAVHQAIADSVNDQHGHRFWMSQSKTATKARTSRKSVNEALARLEADGFLLRTNRRGPADTVEFVFLFPDVDVVYETRTTPTEGVTPRDTPPVTPRDTTSNESSHPLSREVTQTQGNPKEPKESAGKRRRSRSLPPDDFEPNDHHRHLATTLRLDVDAERRAFVDGAHAHGRTYANHDRAFNEWLRRAPDIGPARPLLDLEPPSGPSNVAGDPGRREVGPYECRLGLGCANGNTLNADGALIGRCPCTVREKTGARA